VLGYDIVNHYTTLMRTSARKKPFKINGLKIKYRSCREVFTGYLNSGSRRTRILPRSLEKIRFFLFVFCFLLSTSFAAPEKVLSLQAAIDQLLTSAPHQVNMGLLVTEMSGKPLYSQNATHHFVPASNQKLVTALAALLHLGKEYQFQTTLLSASDTIQQGTLEGALILRFSGDPTLKVEELQNLFAQLHSKGIKRIQGDIAIDNGIFGTQPIGPGWMWDDLDSCFSAPVTANILNGNCVGLVVTPADTLEKPLTIKSHQQGRLVFITNETRTEPNERQCRLSVKLNPENNYILNGCLTQNSQPRNFSMPLTDPNQYLARVIHELMSIEKITFSGKIIFDDNPKAAFILATHASQPLSTIVNEFVKDSDNLMADAVFKTMGANYFGKPGTWQKGAKAVKAILKKHTRIDLNDAVIVDGSGLSRYNLISPEKLVALLQYAYTDPRVSQIFYDALPAAGIDGTLENRMKQFQPTPDVHAKTGTMRGVSALSGYIKTKSQQTLIFSMMINGIPSQLDPYYELEDRICGVIAKL
jgi:serine-type D-Ala-D-Ala carboxypeptidase/endopeptidase (penicillin-binding protein 4)